MKTMKRTILVGVSVFALISGVSAQTGVSLETFQTNWQQSNNVTTMTPTLYEQMKTEWINSNAPSDDSRTLPVEMSATEKQAIKDAEQRLAMGVPSDYPLMQNTGNPALDAENYAQAKDLWIQNNPEAYSQMISTSTMTDAQRQEIRQIELNNQN